MSIRPWLTPLAVLVTVVMAVIYYAVEPKLTNYGAAAPSIVRVGVLPDISKEDLQQRYSPLLEYLSEATGLDFTLVLPADYTDLQRLFGAGDVDLALFGGLTFVQAQASYQAEPLVMRDVDTRFVSVFVVRNDDPTTELTELKGKVLAFGSSLSTSGHLMPRFFLQNHRQIIPENFFGQVLYSGAHDKTAYMVRNREADIGVANAEIIDGMLHDGRLKPGELRVVWETPPYPDYVWAVSRHMDEDIKTLLRNAYLELDPDDEHHRRILAGLGARNFLPAGSRIFQPLQQIAANLELLGAK